MTTFRRGAVLIPQQKEERRTKAKREAKKREAEDQEKATEARELNGKLEVCRDLIPSNKISHWPRNRKKRDKRNWRSRRKRIPENSRNRLRYVVIHTSSHGTPFRLHNRWKRRERNPTTRRKRWRFENSTNGSRYVVTPALPTTQRSDFITEGNEAEGAQLWEGGGD